MSELTSEIFSLVLKQEETEIFLSEEKYIYFIGWIDNKRKREREKGERDTDSNLSEERKSDFFLKGNLSHMLSL